MDEDVYIIIPIGGILAVIGGILAVIVYGIKMAALENGNVAVNFANSYTVIFLVVFAIIALLMVIAIRHFFETLFVAIPSGITIFLSLSLSYVLCIEWLSEFIHSIGEVPIITLLVAPLMILFLLFELALALLPNLLYYICLFSEKKIFVSPAYFVIVGILLNIAYIPFLYVYQLFPYIENCMIK